MIDAIEHYHRLYRSAPGSFAFRAETVEELRQWQADFRRKLEDVLGLNRMRHDLADHQPRAEQVDSTQLDGYSRESWLLWVEPTVALPFFVLRPQGASGPLPLVLTPHGHNHPHIYVGLYTDENERKSAIEGERDIAVQAAREGYIASAPTTRGFGDTRTQEDAEQNKLSSCRIQLLHGLLVGRTPIGERVWDISRLLDWAMQNLDVDETRIAITGNSGGGTVSVFAPACDTRISVAMPSCYFCTFAGSIGSIFHCDCNYVPGILCLGEMHDVAGLIAPRPFCAIAGEEDGIFPIDEVRVAYQKLRQVYAVAGKPDNCRLYVGKGGHRYYKEGAWPLVRQHFESRR